MHADRIDHSGMRLGRSRRSDDPRTVRLAAHLTVAPKAPSTCDYVSRVGSWPMYLNDRFGDCTFADVGHQIQAWTTYARGSTVTLPDDPILRGYEDVTAAEGGRFDPQTGANDNGCVEVDVLNYWRRTGVGGHKIVAYAAVNLADANEVKYAIDTFGGIYTGFDLPLSCQEQVVWTAGRGERGQPGSWGGHAIPLLRYDRRHVTCITWGAPKEMTWAFFRRYCDEAYAVIAEDWLDAAGGKTPKGLDLNGLYAAVKDVAA